MMVRCYLVSVADKYELPLAVFSKVAEAADFVGMTAGSLRSALCRKNALRTGYEVEMVPLGAREEKDVRES